MLDALLAFALEEHIAYREGLVDDEHVGLGDGSDGEGDARGHTRRVVFQRHVHEVFKFGELDDFIHLAVDELPRVTEEGTVEVDVLAGGELVVKARPERDKGGDVAADHTVAGCGFEYAGNYLEHG